MSKNKEKGGTDKLQSSKEKLIKLLLLKEIKKQNKNSITDIVKKKEKKEDKPLEEISDAIKDVIKDTKEESRESFSNYSTKRQMYELLNTKIQSLDYSKLHYGKIAEPLAVKWQDSDYEENNGSYHIAETISMEEVNDIIKEKAFADLQHASTGLLRSETNYQFKYFKAMNPGLVKLKYDLAFK
jgi:gas vesicle protein